MIRTARLSLLPATPELARADLAGRLTLEGVLRIPVHREWPPPLFDAPAIEGTLKQLEGDPGQAGWGFYYLVREDPPSDRRVVGIAGYKGKPGKGTVEIGYSVVPAEQGHGIATEAAEALVARAFTYPEVLRVLGETLPHLGASITVLERNGLRLVGPGSEPGVIRFELTRADFEAGRTRTPLHLRSLLRLLAHAAWADQGAQAALRSTPVPDPTALALYAHVLGAEAVWLARLNGSTPTIAVWPTLTIDECGRLADEMDRSYRAFLWQASPADLQRMVTYHNSAGATFETTVEDIILHVCLHGSYHRGQLAARLRAAGTAPVPTDYIGFVRGAPAATRSP